MPDEVIYTHDLGTVCPQWICSASNLSTVSTKASDLKGKSNLTARTSFKLIEKFCFDSCGCLNMHEVIPDCAYPPSCQIDFVLWIVLSWFHWSNDTSCSSWLRYTKWSIKLTMGIIFKLTSHSTSFPLLDTSANEKVQNIWKILTKPERII